MVDRIEKQDRSNLGAVDVSRYTNWSDYMIEDYLGIVDDLGVVIEKINEIIEGSPLIYSVIRLTNTDSPYTATSIIEIIFANTNSGNIIVNLPAGIEGTHYRLANTGSSGNPLTVNPNGIETIRGGASLVLTDGQFTDLYFETTEYWW